MRSMPFWPVALNVIAWLLASFNLAFAIYIWRNGR